MTENQTQAAPDAIRAALGQAIIACKDSHAWDAPAGCPSTDCHLRCPFSPALARLAALEAALKAADGLIRILRPDDHSPDDGLDAFFPALREYEAALRALALD